MVSLALITKLDKNINTPIEIPLYKNKYCLY